MIVFEIRNYRYLKHNFGVEKSKETKKKQKGAIKFKAENRERERQKRIFKSKNLQTAKSNNKQKEA